MLGPVVAVGINTLALKPVLDRTHQNTLAYPSGHTAVLVTFRYRLRRLAEIGQLDLDNAEDRSPSCSS